jgi:hypothetical protein
MQLSVREIQQQDIEPLVNYWMTATPEFLTGMGVDLQKMPRPEEFTMMLNEQINTPLKDKKTYASSGWKTESRLVIRTSAKLFSEKKRICICISGITRQEKKEMELRSLN